MAHVPCTVSDVPCKVCGVVPRWFSDWDMCNNCSGSGEDDSFWDDVCIYCQGFGEVDRGGYECECREDDFVPASRVTETESPKSPGPPPKGPR